MLPAVTLKTCFKPVDRLIEGGFRLVTLVVLISLACKAWVDVDIVWDSWHYHFPLAAQLWGLIPTGSYIPDPMIQTRLQTFPFLGEWLQGAFWALSGRLQAANLVAYASLLGFLYFARRQLNVPVYYLAISLLAVPLIQIHATLCHVDLPGNLALSVCLLLTWQVLTQRRPLTLSQLSLFVGCSVVAANMKIIYGIIVLPFLLAVLPDAIRQAKQQVGLSVWGLTLASLGFSLLLFAAPIRNIAQFHNPFYGTNVQIGSWKISDGFDYEADHPQNLKHANNLQRWLYSLAEWDRPPLTWSFDQHFWNLGLTMNGPGDFIGGYFNALVLFNTLLCVFSCRALWSLNLMVAQRTTLFMLALTGFTGFLPQSCLLRYYMFWIIILITLNWTLLVILRAHDGIKQDRLHQVAAVQLVLFLIVVSATGFQYLLPQGRSLTTIRRMIDPLPTPLFRTGHAYCLTGITPFGLLYSEGFNPTNTHYVLNDKGWPPVTAKLRPEWPPVFTRHIIQGLCQHP